MSHDRPRARGEIEGRTPFGLEVFGAVTTQLGQLAHRYAAHAAQGAARAIVRGRSRGRRAGVDLPEQPEHACRHDHPAQALTNLVFTAARLWGGLRLTAAVQNLFDASLADPGGPEHRQDRIPQPGRQFWLKIDYAFR